MPKPAVLCQPHAISQQRNNFYYANHAISQQRNNQSRGCGFAGVRWHLDYNKHYNGCMSSGVQWSVRETNLRQNALNTCSKTGGKTEICQAYANNAIAQQRANLNRGCGFAGGLWHLDYQTHHKWCMLASAQARGKATNDRRDALNRCTEVGKYPDRTLVKGSGPKVYIIMNGKACWIPSRFIFESMGFGWNSILTISDSDLKSKQKAPLLVKGSGNKVYKIEADKRRWIVNPEVFNRLGLDWKTIVSISDISLNRIPEASPIR